ncbi:MAG: hypothetical protein II886_07880 [Prevotella sp.]|nr:hypothetical protein [Prevotella sp.]
MTNLNPDEGVLEPGGDLSRTVRNLAAPRPLTVSAPSGLPFHPTLKRPLGWKSNAAAPDIHQIQQHRIYS